ncbi:PASTA domain-containing protein [Kocuria sp.]|uniref:PASTA domain-containing protein n=1 Tax=Kocuria sp. TaxID=1871328 RepID=UPI0026DFC820|nr:PASTA domain-containing protein [Kocuria sp.]MDO5617801.1 PASTA domain-containing protein [Kocuria sp.]
MSLKNTPALRASLAVLLLAGGFTVAGCGGNDNTSADATPSAESTATASATDSATAETTIPDFTEKPLYDAIVFARENDLSYQLEGAEIADIDNTREYTVTEQTPEAGSEFKPRDVLTLTVEQQ